MTKLETINVIYDPLGQIEDQIELIEALAKLRKKYGECAFRFEINVYKYPE
jgi:hypothetical protein